MSFGQANYTDATYAGTSFPAALYIPAGTTYAYSSWVMFSEEFTPTVVEYLDPKIGARRPARYQTRFVPKITGKDVRRFGQNRGRY